VDAHKIYVDGTTNSFISVYLLHKNTRIFATQFWHSLLFIICQLLLLFLFTWFKNSVLFSPLIWIRITRFYQKNVGIFIQISKQSQIRVRFTLCATIFNKNIQYCYYYLFLLALIGYFYTGTRAKQSRESTIFWKKYYSHQIWPHLNCFI